jgi:hypothetical protein
MKFLKSLSLLCGVFACLGTSANGFMNFNFEQAVVVSNNSSFGFLDWNLAVPGWSHSNGSDTSIVYHGSPHFGMTQYFLLIDSESPFYSSGALLAGNYSLAFASGYLYTPFEMGVNVPWVNAYISQTLTIPSGTQSLQLQATGPFAVSVGGVNAPLFSLGGNSYAADVSAFAGYLQEVKIINTATIPHRHTIVDNIAFSTVAAPEPQRVTLCALATVLAACRRRRQTALF